MGAKGAQRPADAHPLFVIGSIAKMLRVHPQTLRLYERHGLWVDRFPTSKYVSRARAQLRQLPNTGITLQ